MSTERDEQFESWWEREGQFCRAGGGDYEKTFAYAAWCAQYSAQAPQPSQAASPVSSGPDALQHAREHSSGREAQDDPIVGHKTLRDERGLTRHEPLRKSVANALLAAAEAAQAKRASDMPTEQDAARALWSAYQRLKELGWRETCYGPTNTSVRLIEPGSSGIHTGHRSEPWPEKTWWIEDGGDLWLSNPCLFRETDATSGQQGREQAAASGSDEQ